MGSFLKWGMMSVDVGQGFSIAAERYPPILGIEVVRATVGLSDEGPN